MSPISLAAISRTRTKDSREPHADDAIAIAVHDSGPGIARDWRERGLLKVITLDHPGAPNGTLLKTKGS